MSDYASKLKKDLAEQFKNKPHIAAFLDVIGKQLDELHDFYFDLLSKRNVYLAEGVQLDRIGDIVCLSREQVAKIVGGSSASEIDDDLYRKYLIYKILENTCDGTYFDIINGINMIWSGTPVTYAEDPENPATIYLDFDATKDLGPVDNIPVIKPGGVGVRFRLHKKDEVVAYVGLGRQSAVTAEYECEAAEIEGFIYLTDENGRLLVDELGRYLVI